jgi:hypothetical protein
MNPSFQAVWKNYVCAHALSDPNGELMFQASATGLTAAEDTKLGYYNGPRVNGNGNSSINPLPTYLYLFDSTDLRRDVTVVHYFVLAPPTLYKQGQAITNLVDGKYRRDWITNPTPSPSDATQYLGLKWQILRSSDIYLMFAEAENEINGATAAAYNAINMVRRRGYGLPMNTPNAAVDIPAGLSKSEFFKYLVRERALELGGEGIRKYDLIRWNLLGTMIAETKANLVRMSVRNGSAPTTSTPIVNPTYMAGYPSYSLTNQLPEFMYYINNTTAESPAVGGLWFNSIYKLAPTSTPAGTTRVNWVRAEVKTTASDRFATGYTPGKSELMPIPQPVLDANKSMIQNPGY